MIITNTMGLSADLLKTIPDDERKGFRLSFVHLLLFSVYQFGLWFWVLTSFEMNTPPYITALLLAGIMILLDLKLTSANVIKSKRFLILRILISLITGVVAAAGLEMAILKDDTNAFIAEQHALAIAKHNANLNTWRETDSGALNLNALQNKITIENLYLTEQKKALLEIQTSLQQAQTTAAVNTLEHHDQVSGYGNREKGDGDLAKRAALLAQLAQTAEQKLNSNQALVQLNIEHSEQKLTQLRQDFATYTSLQQQREAELFPLPLNNNNGVLARLSALNDMKAAYSVAGTALIALFMFLLVIDLSFVLARYAASYNSIYNANVAVVHAQALMQAHCWVAAYNSQDVITEQIGHLKKQVLAANILDCYQHHTKSVVKATQAATTVAANDANQAKQADLHFTNALNSAYKTVMTDNV